MIIEVVGKEIEKIKGDFESYLNGLNMVGEISYSQYSELYDEGTKQIQRAYELGKSELEKENAELKSEKGCETCTKFDEVQLSKANEIIKCFVTLLTKSRTALDTKTCLMKAEQFLNSEVEK